MDSRLLTEKCTISRPEIVTRDLEQVEVMEVILTDVPCSIVSQKSSFVKGDSKSDRSENTAILFLAGTDILEGDEVEVNCRKYKISDTEPQKFISGYEGSIYATCKLI